MKIDFVEFLLDNFINKGRKHNCEKILRIFQIIGKDTPRFELEANKNLARLAGVLDTHNEIQSVKNIFPVRITPFGDITIAFNIFSEHSDSVSLIISDFIMPEKELKISVNGLRLLLKELNPEKTESEIESEVLSYAI